MPTANDIFIIGLPVVLVVFMLWLQWSQKNKQKKLIESMRPNDKVVTNGGLIGKIEQVKRDVVVLKVDDKTRVEVLKSSISQYFEEAVK
ncbi:MAG: preprotein translocase subunit YajC [Firmicutes bacterium]|nr:preprotein translocase subunit YajC [Bacillota bacterium]